ncbi:MAG TPA: cupin domain-containing protein [Gemmatimonadales bacterium]|nr:cupin domain-containing protein [Gemmatimonadales bacterium]
MLNLRIVCAATVCGAGLVGTAEAQNPPAKGDRARVAFAQALPQLNGAKLKATLVEVTYAPGDSSTAHSHPCPVVGYVIEGSYRTRSGDEPEAMFTAGQTFYEAPGAVHRVSANASKERPVRFLAYFVCDTEAPLSAPARP